MRLLISLGLAAAAIALPHGYPSVPMRGVSGTVDMPLIGTGTWLYNSSLAQQVVIDTFKLGYRHVDTAVIYENQDGVGIGLAKAVKAAGLERGDYFVTSKIPPYSNASAALQALDETLKQLDLSFVDLMLLHFPSGKGAAGAAQRKEQWLALEKWAKQGKARAIGVSHHCKKHLQDVLSVATLPIALNQNQYHVGMALDSQPRLHDKRFNEENDILYMSYSPLCGPCPHPDNMELITGNLVSSIGKKHNKTGSQVALRWLVQQGIPVIPKSSNVAHMRSNFEIFDFELTDDEMKKLASAASPAETGTKQSPDDAQDCDFEEDDLAVPLWL